jgi:hypothetical protein
MSKMMENKQMIHIVSEIIVLGGLIYYFNQKNKKLLSHIQDLSRKIEEQEGILQKHEEIIIKISEFINQQKNISTPIIKKIPLKENRTKKSEPIKVSFKQNPSPIKNKITQRVEEISSSEEEEEEEESDLDAELEEELQELEIEEIEIEKLSLKKKN